MPRFGRKKLLTKLTAFHQSFLFSVNLHENIFLLLLLYYLAINFLLMMESDLNSLYYLHMFYYLNMSEFCEPHDYFTEITQTIYSSIIWVEHWVLLPFLPSRSSETTNSNSQVPVLYYRQLFPSSKTSNFSNIISNKK